MTTLQRCDWRSGGGSSSETTPPLLALLMWVLVHRPVSLHPDPPSETLRFKHAEFFFISITASFGSVSGMFVDLQEWAPLDRAAHLETAPSSGPVFLLLTACSRPSRSALRDAAASLTRPHEDTCECSVGFTANVAVSRGGESGSRRRWGSCRQQLGAGARVGVHTGAPAASPS